MSLTPLRKIGNWVFARLASGDSQRVMPATGIDLRWYAFTSGAELRLDPKDKANYPPGTPARARTVRCTCDNWFKPDNKQCTGRLVNLDRSTRVTEPNYCRDCAGAGFAGGLNGKETGLEVRAKASGWAKSNGGTTAAERRENGVIHVRGIGGCMSKEEVKKRMLSDDMKPVMQVPPGIERGRIISKLYRFAAQLKGARDAPHDSRHHHVWKETELVLGLVYHKIGFYNWDIETRGSGVAPPGNPKRLYDSSIHYRKDWRDPFESAKPFVESAPAYHNPPACKQGIYDEKVVDAVLDKLGGIKQEGKYCAVWFGKEGTYARAMGLGAIIVDAGYLIRNLLGH